MELKIKLVSFFVLAIGLTFQSVAQNSYRPGYIVTQVGDTTTGYINYEIDAKLCKRVQFRNEASESESRIYKPEELLGFGFNTGRTFKTITIGKGPSQTFAKNIEQGKLDMLIIPIDGTTDFNVHLERKDTNLVVNLNPPQKSSVTRDDKNYSQKDRRFLGRLAYITKDRPADLDIEKTKYSERSLKKYVAGYNHEFSKEFAVSEYKDDYKITYDVLGGINPLGLTDEVTQFRFSIYRDKNFIEKSEKYARRYGLSYRYWRDHDVDTLKSNSSLNYLWQNISIIPLAYRIQGASRKFIPYAYLGVGISTIISTNYRIIDYQIVDTENIVSFLPTFNFGAGMKMKIKSNYLLVEITPALNGPIFINVGLTF